MYHSALLLKFAVFSFYVNWWKLQSVQSYTIIAYKFDIASWFLIDPFSVKNVTNPLTTSAQHLTCLCLNDELKNINTLNQLQSRSSFLNHRYLVSFQIVPFNLVKHTFDHLTMFFLFNLNNWWTIYPQYRIRTAYYYLNAYSTLFYMYGNYLFLVYNI